MGSCPETDSKVHERTTFARNNPGRLAYILSSEEVARHGSWSTACTQDGYGHCTARIQEAETPQTDPRWGCCFRGTSGGDVWGFPAETRGTIGRAQHGMDRHGEAGTDVAAGSRAWLARSEP